MLLRFWNGPNFGDQLNTYIFPKLFPDLLKRGDEKELWGIGSLIDSRIDRQQHAILFGTGVRDPLLDFKGHLWDIRFVRGPLSALCLGQNTSYISDAAYLLLLIDDFLSIRLSTKKKFPISIIPYKNYASILPWKKICAALGAHYIDPAADIRDVIEKIAASELVVAGAMHGAIVADICRVPWLRLRMDQFPPESDFLTEFKWSDWAHGIDIGHINSISISTIDQQTASRVINRFLFTLDALVRLRNPAHHKFQLSKDSIIDGIRVRLLDACDALRQDYLNQ